MSQAEIQLRNLHPAEGDDAVRKTDRYEGIKALVENIKRFGLLVPLLVRPRQDDRSQYDVIDGNRRLMALCEIHEDPAVVVNCMVVGIDAGAGQALSANTMRQAMNPMDQYDVFAQLVAEGMKTTKVAKLFDLPPKRVNQVLALASLAPSIKDQVRKGDLSWETAQALTLIKDQKVQVQVLEQHGDHPWGIKNVVHDEAPRMETAIFDKNTYFIEGGQLLVDLFDEDPSGEELCADSILFWKLQMAAIEVELDKLRGQGWKAVIEGDGIVYRRADWPRRAEVKSKKARAMHTVVYEIEDDGRFHIWEVVMPEPEMVKEAKAEARVEAKEIKRAEAEAEGVEVEMTGNRPMSSSLVHELKEARSRQVKLALSAHPRLAARVFVMLLAMADYRRGYAARAADLQWKPKEPNEATMREFPVVGQPGAGIQDNARQAAGRDVEGAGRRHPGRAGGAAGPCRGTGLRCPAARRRDHGEGDSGNGAGAWPQRLDARCRVLAELRPGLHAEGVGANAPTRVWRHATRRRRWRASPSACRSGSSGRTSRPGSTSGARTSRCPRR